MKRRLFLYGVCTVVLLVLSSNNHLAMAQDEKEELLNQEWVKNDVDGVAVLMKLMPVESLNVEALIEELRDTWTIDDEILGFGAHRVSLGKGYGYSSIYIDVLTFNNQVAYYEMGVNGTSERWSEYREQIIDAWKKNGGPEFTEQGYKLTHKNRFESVFDAYYRAVAGELGEMKPVRVPAGLKDDYEYLTSPLKISLLGEGTCGYGGSVLEGKTSIDALINSRRMDLIENVLRGYNPGGRIFAAIALLRMQRQGLKLSSATVATLNRVINLEIPVSTCSGCIISSGRKTNDVVEEFLRK